jgi:hypothetical protein
MTDKERIKSLASQLALTLGIAIGCAHKHHDLETIRLLLACDFAKELAEGEPDRLLGQLMRTYGS